MKISICQLEIDVKQEKIKPTDRRLPDVEITGIFTMLVNGDPSEALENQRAIGSAIMKALTEVEVKCQQTITFTIDKN